MAKGQTLQDPFLNILRKEKVPVSIYLVNGIKLQGQVDSFDQFVVLAQEQREPDGVQTRDLDRRAVSQRAPAVAGRRSWRRMTTWFSRAVTWREVVFV